MSDKDIKLEYCLNISVQKGLVWEMGILKDGRLKGRGAGGCAQCPYTHIRTFCASRTENSLTKWEGNAAGCAMLFFSPWRYCKDSKYLCNIKTTSNKETAREWLQYKYIACRVHQLDIYMANLQWRNHKYCCCHSYNGLVGHILYHFCLALIYYRKQRIHLLFIWFLFLSPLHLHSALPYTHFTFTCFFEGGLYVVRLDKRENDTK